MIKIYFSRNIGINIETIFVIKFSVQMIGNKNNCDDPFEDRNPYKEFFFRFFFYINKNNQILSKNRR